MPHKILVGMTVWCPDEPQYSHRAVVAKEGFDNLLRARRDTVGFDLLVIDNETTHPLVLEAMDRLKGQDNVSIARFTPQLGWAGGRNKMIQVFMNGPWERLVMKDQDMFIFDYKWPDKVEALITTEPGLSAYMMCVSKQDKIGAIWLKGGTEAIVMNEYLGGINIIDKRVVERIGGYNTKDLPGAWGYHDCCFGRRLKYSGLLDYCNASYVDPIDADTEHRNTSHIEPDSQALHDRMLREHGPSFSRREFEIRQGKGLFQPFL